MKGLTIFLSVLLSVFSAESAFTEPRGRGMSPGDGWSAYSESTLCLTQEQKDQLQRMRENYIREVTHPYYRLISRQVEIRLLWTEPDPDPKKILAKEKEISRIQGQINEKAIQYRLNCRSILTKEQKAKLTSGSTGMSQGHGPGWRGRYQSVFPGKDK